MQQILFSTVAVFALILGQTGLGIAEDNAPTGNVVNLVAPGNLEGTNPGSTITSENIPSSVNPVDLARRSIGVFPTQPDEALRLVTVAQLYAFYDMTRVSDKTAHQAWPALKQNLGLDKLIHWGRRHPNDYKLASVWTMNWAKHHPPPSYYPSWMIQHGMNAFLKDKQQGGVVENHDPQVAWAEQIKNFEKFALGEHWAKLEDELKPENVKNTLRTLNQQLISQYQRFASGEELKAMETDLNKIIAEYDQLTGSPGDRLYQIEQKVEEYLWKQLANPNRKPKNGKPVQ